MDQSESSILAFHSDDVIRNPERFGNKFCGKGWVRGARVSFGTIARQLMRLNQLRRLEGRQNKPFILQTIKILQ